MRSMTQSHLEIKFSLNKLKESKTPMHRRKNDDFGIAIKEDKERDSVRNIGIGMVVKRNSQIRKS